MRLDERAFASCYEQNSRALWSYLYRVTGKASDADDLVQEAFCRLLQANVSEVCFLHPWESRFRDPYDALVARIGRDSFRRVVIDDPDAEWAQGRAAHAERALGHEMLAD